MNAALNSLLNLPLQLFRKVVFTDSKLSESPLKLNSGGIRSCVNAALSV